MKKQLQKILDNYIDSLIDKGFKEMPTSNHEVSKHWRRLLRTWTHEDFHPEFVIADYEVIYRNNEEKGELGTLRTYTPVNWIQLQSMQQAVEMECPCCESEDPNTCKH